MSQELAGQRSGEAETDHPAREGATRDSARLHRGDELSQLLLIHRNIPTDLPVMPLPLHPDRYFAAMMRSCANANSRVAASGCSYRIAALTVTNHSQPNQHRGRCGQSAAL